MSGQPDSEIDVTAQPSGTGCAECLAGDSPGWWVHLRRCAACGHIGCCDSSPSQHGSMHAEMSGHPVLTSFEPGEDWFYDVRTNRFMDGPTLAEPTARPASQPVPGPAGAVPGDWQQRVR